MRTARAIHHLQQLYCHNLRIKAEEIPQRNWGVIREKGQSVGDYTEYGVVIVYVSEPFSRAKGHTQISQMHSSIQPPAHAP